MLITGESVSRGRLFDHQAIDQDSVAAAICPENFKVDDVSAIDEIVNRAILQTTRAGHRPVVLQISAAALQAECPAQRVAESVTSEKGTDFSLPGDLAQRLKECEKPLLLVGAGALPCAKELASFATHLNALITTTPAARGIVSESDWRVLPVDLLCDDVEAFNRLIDESDLVIALGCRFSHNGTGGYSMRLPQDRLVHVHEDPAVLNANYEAAWAFKMEVTEFISAASAAIMDGQRSASGGWTEAESSRWRAQVLERSADESLEPKWSEAEEPGCQALFEQIRSGIPDDAMLVTDTGMHQILTRKYFEVRSPRGLVVPTDFQSMGFGLPAAIGAALAVPERKVVALVGDGTFLMTLSELVTIAREQIPLLIVVFADGWLGQIRMQQVEWGAEEFATRLHGFELETVAKSVGIHYQRGQRNLSDQIKACLQDRLPAILEVQVEDPPRLDRFKSRLRKKEKIKNILGPAGISFIKKIGGKSSG